MHRSQHYHEFAECRGILIVHCVQGVVEWPSFAFQPHNCDHCEARCAAELHYVDHLVHCIRDMCVCQTREQYHTMCIVCMWHRVLVPPVRWPDVGSHEYSTMFELHRFMPWGISLLRFTPYPVDE